MNIADLDLKTIQANILRLCRHAWNLQDFVSRAISARAIGFNGDAVSIIIRSVKWKKEMVLVIGEIRRVLQQLE